MRTVLILIAACGLLGVFFACGGAETPVAEPEAPDVTPDEPEVVDSEDAEPTDDGKEVEAAGGETSGDDTAAKEPPAEKVEGEAVESEGEAEGETGGDFEGKGVERSVLGTDAGAKGTTNFDHWKHQKLGVKCFQCHHKGAGRKSCGASSDCHKFKEVNAPAAKDAFHKACNGCHRKKELPKGCDFCHQPKAS